MRSDFLRSSAPYRRSVIWHKSKKMKYTIIELSSGYINLVYYPTRFERRILVDIPLRITLEQLQDGVEVVIIKEYINEVETHPFGTSFDIRVKLHTDIEAKDIEKEILEELIIHLNEYIKGNLPEYVKTFKPATLERTKPRIIVKDNEE